MKKNLISLILLGFVINGCTDDDPASPTSTTYTFTAALGYMTLDCSGVAFDGYCQENSELTEDECSQWNDIFIMRHGQLGDMSITLNIDGTFTGTAFGEAESGNYTEVNNVVTLILSDGDPWILNMDGTSLKLQFIDQYGCTDLIFTS